MALLSFTAAATMAGVSRVTMTKHVKSGKVSTVTAPDGSRKIDTAELLRVYGVLAKDTAKGRVNSEQVTDNALQGKIDALLSELSLTKQLLAERGELVQALKAQIALIGYQPDPLPAKIPDPPQPDPPQPESAVERYQKFEELLKLKYEQNVQ
jgi:hypothetical protein